jgi:Rrf2 family protein
MHITLESDYAVRIVICLVNEAGRLDAKIISERAGVTLRFSLKILRKLATGGIVRSYKGSKGGYELAKPPQKISLRDVIEAIEGKYSLSRCLYENYDCSRDMPEPCRLKSVFNDISSAVEEKLNSYTLDMLI